MFVEEMAEMIGRAHGAALDAVTRALWAAVATGQVGDDDATRLSDAIQTRRMLGKVAQAAAGRDERHLAQISRRKLQRPPERSVAIERRRLLAASGPMPPALGARFTTGEAAVLRIVADEVKARQICALCLDAIAARAGVSRTTAQNAIRQAKRLGMVEVQERRRPGAKSLPNLVKIIDREWLTWIKHHGFKKLNTTDKVGFREEKGRIAPLSDALTFAARTNLNDCANEGRLIHHRMVRRGAKL
jgi:hypothetical protein